MPFAPISEVIIIRGGTLFTYVKAQRNFHNWIFKQTNRNFRNQKVFLTYAQHNFHNQFL